MVQMTQIYTILEINTSELEKKGGNTDDNIKNKIYWTFKPVNLKIKK